MSSQVGGSIGIPAGFDPKRQTLQQYRSKSIEPNGFSLWAADHMFKSSYAHFHSKDSTQPKTSVIPGYQGFIPKNRAQSLHANRITNISKQIFGVSNYGKNQTGLASNGFNVSQQALIDHSKIGSTSKYGRSSWLKAHPAWQSGQWQTTTKETYIDPKSRVNPTYRETNKLEEYRKPAALSSGFSTNRAYWDGNGWNPQKVLKAEHISTEYRDIYNPQKGTHRDPNVSVAKKLKLNESNYRFNY